MTQTEKQIILNQCFIMNALADLLDDSTELFKSEALFTHSQEQLSIIGEPDFITDKVKTVRLRKWKRIAALPLDEGITPATRSQILRCREQLLLLGETYTIKEE